MLRIVRKHHASTTVIEPAAPRDGERGRELQRLALGKRLGRRPRVDGQRAAVGRQRATGRRSSLRIAAILRREDGRIEQPLDRLDAQIVRDVEDVGDERHLDRVAAGGGGRRS